MEIVSNHFFPGRVVSFNGALKNFWQSLIDHVIPHSGNQYHPHALSHQALVFWSLLLVAVKVATVVVITFGPVLPAFSSAITQDNVAALTNSSRLDFGLNKLTYSEKLAQAAQIKANDMLAKQYFAHNTPEGKRPWDFIKAAGYSYVVAGENLAIHFQQAEDIEEAWMNSPGHRANILNKDFEEIGIGLAQGEFEGYETTVVVQMFATPMAHLYTPLVVPTKVATQEAPAPLPVTAGDVVRKLEVAQNSDVNISAKEQGPAVTGTDLSVENGKLLISVKIIGDVSKVIAHYGENSVMLNPKEGGLWFSTIELSKLARANTPLVIDAFDARGEIARTHTASFSHSLFEIFGTSPVAVNQVPEVKVFGLSFDPNNLSRVMFTFFILVALMALFVVILAKRHVQHLNLIAHSSLVIVLASMLWIW